MKKSFQQLVVLLFVFSIFSLNGQSSAPDFDIHWGTENSESYVERIIAHDESGVYSINTKKEKRKWKKYLQFHSNALRATRSLKLEFTPRQGEEIEFKEIIQLNDKLFLFTTSINKKKEVNALYVQSINTQTLRLNNNVKLVAKGGAFEIKTSIDKNKAVVVKRATTEDDGNIRLGIQVFNGELNEDWSKIVKLPYTDEIFRRSTPKIDEEGRVYFICKIYREKPGVLSLKKAMNYESKILVFRNEESTLQEYSIGEKDKILRQIAMTFHENGNVVCSGFYSEKSLSSIKGSYFLMIDNQSMEVIAKKFTEFDLEFKSQHLIGEQKRKIEKKNSAEMLGYAITDLVRKDDGGVVIMAEQQGINKVKSDNGTITRYHNYNVIVVNISSEGNIIWKAKIPKKQIAQNHSEYSSYALFINANNLYLLYNDNVKNKNYDGSKKLRRYSFIFDSSVVLIHIDAQGVQTKSELIPYDKKSSVELKTLHFRQVDEDNLVVLARKSGQEKLVNFSLK